MPNGLLYRVGVDSEAGRWNAPCRADRSFCYVPIPDEAAGGRGSMFDHTYDEFVPFVTALGSSWPAGLRGWCHLDPDFSQLTYGDAGSRAQRICEFIVPGSFIVFWAGMRWLDGPQAGVCAREQRNQRQLGETTIPSAASGTHRSRAPASRTFGCGSRPRFPRKLRSAFLCKVLRSVRNSCARKIAAPFSSGRNAVACAVPSASSRT